MNYDICSKTPFLVRMVCTVLNKTPFLVRIVCAVLNNKELDSHQLLLVFGFVCTVLNKTPFLVRMVCAVLNNKELSNSIHFKFISKPRTIAIVELPQIDLQGGKFLYTCTKT